MQKQVIHFFVCLLLAWMCSFECTTTLWAWWMCANQISKQSDHSHNTLPPPLITQPRSWPHSNLHLINDCVGRGLHQRLHRPTQLIGSPFVCGCVLPGQVFMLAKPLNFSELMRKTLGKFHTLPNPHQRVALGLPCLAKGHLGMQLMGLLLPLLFQWRGDSPRVFQPIFDRPGPYWPDIWDHYRCCCSFAQYFSLSKAPHFIFFKKQLTNSLHESIESLWFSLYPHLTTGNIDRQCVSLW